MNKFQRLLATVLLWMHVQILWVTVRQLGIYAHRENLSTIRSNAVITWWLTYAEWVSWSCIGVVIAVVVTSVVRKQPYWLYAAQVVLGAVWILSLYLLLLPLMFPRQKEMGMGTARRNEHRLNYSPKTDTL